MRNFILIILFTFCFNSYSQYKIEKNLQLVLDTVIPRFKANGTIQKVFDSLSEETVRKDPDSPVLSLVYFPPKHFEENGLEAEEGDSEKDLKISVDFENLTVGEIIKNLCIGYNLRYKLEKRSVMVLHPNEETENLNVRFFKLALSDIKKLEGDGAQKFLESQGIAFNLHCFAKYLPSINAVAVRNNEEELKKSEKCFDLFRINELLQGIKNQLKEKGIQNEELNKRLKNIDDLINDEFNSNLLLAEKELKLNTKLNLVIPKVRFVDRDLDSIVDFIRRTSRDLDIKGESINLVVKADIASMKKTVNLHLNDATVQEVIMYICKKLGLSYKVNENSVIIGRLLKGSNIVKSYDSSDYFVKYVNKEYKKDFKKALQNLGVNFKPGSSIDYLKNIQRIVISNSPQEHKKLYEIFTFFNGENK